MVSGWIELTKEKLQTTDGINELNRMLRNLHELIAGDGETVRIYSDNGAPSLAAGNGSLYLRLDTGKLYVMESSVWTIK